MFVLTGMYRLIEMIYCGRLNEKKLKKKKRWPASCALSISGWVSWNGWLGTDTRMNVCVCVCQSLVSHEPHEAASCFSKKENCRKILSMAETDISHISKRVKANNS